MRRATSAAGAPSGSQTISIHALHEEGDFFHPLLSIFFQISIHALHEEGDVVNVFTELPIFDFYPRPP